MTTPATTTTHTPGPWTSNYQTVVAPDAMGMKGPLVAEAVTLADARLIAAAPEMLEALRKAHSAITDMDYVDNPTARLIYDVIRKATGGS